MDIKQLEQQMYDITEKLFANNSNDPVRWAEYIIAKYTEKGVQAFVDNAKMQAELESLRKQAIPEGYVLVRKTTFVETPLSDDPEPLI